jgi:hypothetical protein
MSNHSHRRLLLWALCLLCLSCAREYALDMILLDRPAGIERMVISSQIGGVSRPLDPNVLPANTSRVWIPLPNQESGRMGVTVTAQTEVGCSLGQWNTTLDLPASEQLIQREVPRSGDGRVQCPIVVKQSRQRSATGTVTVKNTGSSSPLSICDSADCPPVYASGQVQFTAAAGINTRFAGWQGACSSFGQQTACTLSAGIPITTTAVFEDLCSVDGFCPVVFPSAVPSTLNFVAGSSASDVWMVGDSGAILHWNGTALLQEPVGSSQSLRAVASVMTPGGSEQWLAGYGGTLLRRTGSTWGPTPSAGMNDWEMIALTKRGADFFALVSGNGVFGKPVGDPFWQNLALPAGAYVRSLYTPDSFEVWAGTSQGFLLRFDGKAWIRYCDTVLGTKASDSLRGILPDADKGLWILNVDGIYRVTFGATVSCSAFLSMSSLMTSPPPLRRMAAGPGQKLWLVGEQGLIATVDPTVTPPARAGTVLDSGTKKNLYGVYVDPDAHVWAVGEGGTIVRR